MSTSLQITRTPLADMLRQSLWARHLARDELDWVIAHTRERRVGPGGYAIRCGDPADHWIGVVEGLVKMSITHADGRHSSLCCVTDGGWAGEGSLLRPGRWRYDGVAVRDSRLACMPRVVFERLMSTNIGFNRFLLQHLNARLGLFISLVENDRLLGPDARVARCLASLFDPDLYPGARRHVRLSQEEIGLLAAVSRQRANTALHLLERAGLVRVEFRGVTILDLPGLREFQGAAPEAGARLAIG